MCHHLKQWICSDRALGMGNISILLYIVVLRAHDNRVVVVLHKIKLTLPDIYYLGTYTTHLSAYLRRNCSNLAQKVYKKPTKRHYIEYRDILMHDNRHHF